MSLLDIGAWAIGSLLYTFMAGYVGHGYFLIRKQDGHRNCGITEMDLLAGACWPLAVPLWLGALVSDRVTRKPAVRIPAARVESLEARMGGPAEMRKRLDEGEPR